MCVCVCGGGGITVASLSRFDPSLDHVDTVSIHYNMYKDSFFMIGLHQSQPFQVMEQVQVETRDR